MAKSGIYAFGVTYQTKVVYVYQDKIGHVEKGKISIWVCLSIFRVAGSEMHNKWDISKIEAVIQELNKRLDYQCNLKIEISKRAQKRMGAFFYRKNNGRIEPLKFVFAQCLLDGSYSEEVVKEVIIHEYLHYYCDTITGVSNGHNSYFKKMCRIMGISDSATFKYDTKRKSDTAYKYKIYCSKCNKYICGNKRIDFANNKVKKYISSCCKAKLIIK